MVKRCSVYEVQTKMIFLKVRMPWIGRDGLNKNINLKLPDLQTRERSMTFVI